MKVLRMRSWNFHADNLEQMTRFYQDALGAEVRTQHTVGGVNVTRLRAGETGLGLFNAAEKRAPGVPHHTFDIEGPSDPKELIKELEAKGIKVDDLSSRRRPRLLGLRHRPRRQSHRAFEGLNALYAENRGSRMEYRIFDPQSSSPVRSQLAATWAESQRAVRRRRASPSRGPTS
jgi:predicted enzyme related to lactoylglutathione lyase